MDKELLKQAFYQGFIIGKYRAAEFPVVKFEEWFSKIKNHEPNCS